jgi:hypothetical protein
MDDGEVRKACGVDVSVRVLEHEIDLGSGLGAVSISPPPSR